MKDRIGFIEFNTSSEDHLFWLDNAPVFSVDKDEDVVAYIDNIITSSKQESNPQLHDLVNRQKNRHSHACRKKSKTICRFNYLQPPMKYL